MAAFTLWALLFAKMVHAVTLNEFMGPYEQDLVLWAAAFALMGGIFRTIFSLQSRQLVLGILPEALWDAAKAVVSGLLVFFCIQALRSSGWMVPTEVRFGAIVAAGALRFTAVFWLIDAGREWLEARKAQIINRPVNEPKDTP
jgi:hypothetical protein